VILREKPGFDAADMKHKITIKRKAATTQSTTTGDWSPIGTDTTLLVAWAAANSLSGAEFWTARAMQAEKTVVFKIFYDSAIASLTAQDYIVWNGQTYDIIDPDNLFFENNIMKKKAVVRT